MRMLESWVSSSQQISPPGVRVSSMLITYLLPSQQPCWGLPCWRSYILQEFILAKGSCLLCRRWRRCFSYRCRAGSSSRCSRTRSRFCASLPARSVLDLCFRKRLFDFRELQFWHVLNIRVERSLSKDLHHRSETLCCSSTDRLCTVTEESNKSFRHRLDIVVCRRMLRHL